MSLLTNLLAWYRNDGTDQSGNGNDLTENGGPGTAAGINGESGAAMLVGNSASWFGPTFEMAGDFTYSAWVYITLIENGSELVANDESFILNHRFSLASAGEPASFVSAGGTLEDDAPMESATWYFLAVTHDGTDTKLYVDGIEKDSATYWTVPVADGDGFFLAPSDQTRLQFVGIWSRSLSLAEVGELYNGGTGLDPTAEEESTMPAPDNYLDENLARLTITASRAFAITKSDTVDCAEVTRAVWVGGAGDLTVIMKNGSEVLFASVPAGSLLPIRISRVMSTGTSASAVVGLA